MGLLHHCGGRKKIVLKMSYLSLVAGSTTMKYNVVVLITEYEYAYFSNVGCV